MAISPDPTSATNIALGQGNEDHPDSDRSRENSPPLGNLSLPAMLKTHNPSTDPNESRSTLATDYEQSPWFPSQVRVSPLASNSTGASVQSPTTTGHNSSLTAGLSIVSSGLRNSRIPRAHAVVVCGPAGIGKSSLILAHQTAWRKDGLWGYAKMSKGESSPFTGLVS